MENQTNYQFQVSKQTSMYLNALIQYNEFWQSFADACYYEDKELADEKINLFNEKLSDAKEMLQKSILESIEINIFKKENQICTI